MSDKTATDADSGPGFQPGIANNMANNVAVEPISTKFFKGLNVSLSWALIMTGIVYIGFRLFMDDHDVEKDNKVRDARIDTIEKNASSNIETVYKVMQNGFDKIDVKIDRIYDKIDDFKSNNQRPNSGRDFKGESSNVK